MPTVMWGGWIKSQTKITPHKEPLQWPTLMFIWHPFDGANCREKWLSCRGLPWILSFLQKHLINCLPTAAASSGVVSEIPLRAHVCTQSAGIGWSQTPLSQLPESSTHVSVLTDCRVCSAFQIYQMRGRNKTEEKLEDFPGSPAVTTLGFKCRACRFDPWSGK